MQSTTAQELRRLAQVRELAREMFLRGIEPQQMRAAYEFALQESAVTVELCACGATIVTRAGELPLAFCDECANEAMAATIGATTRAYQEAA